MTDIAIERTGSETRAEVLPAYEPPTLTVMEQDEVLNAFQMTAQEISAAGCWWSSC